MMITSAEKSCGRAAMIRIFGHPQIVTIVGVALLAALAAWPGVLAGQQPADAKKKDVVITKPTPEQVAAHRKALQARHATVKAALVKARAEGEEARRAFLDKQQAELKAENAKVMAEIARLRGGAERK
jgi:hypothetical protein